MGNYRTIVILKTDIVDSTPRLASLTQTEMSLQRKQHKQFISETAAKYQGSVFQEEGDAYLIEFPSVTTAALAAIEMHQTLRSMQAGKSEKQRLAIRAVITVGDILHQGNDMIGVTMSLTARIEKFTPPDEIYLSHAAWLVLNKAEVQTAFVDDFQLKGFDGSEKIYRVVSKHGIRVFADQYIVLADAHGFTNFFKSKSNDAIEEFLLEYDELMNSACERHGGVIRQVNGDLYFMTFTDAIQALDAIMLICQTWKSIGGRFNIGLDLGVHKGHLYAFRSYVFGESINITVSLADLSGQFKSKFQQASVVASGTIRDEFIGTEREGMFQGLDETKLTRHTTKSILREHPAYLLIAE